MLMEKLCRFIVSTHQYSVFICFILLKHGEGQCRETPLSCIVQCDATAVRNPLVKTAPTPVLEGKRQALQ